MAYELLDDDYDGYREHEEDPYDPREDESNWRFTCPTCEQIVGWDEWSYSANICYECRAKKPEFEELRVLVEEVS